MGDSNSRHLAPKASALPTALIPDLVIEFCARCGQTCGHGDFLTTSTCGGSACIAGVSRDCGHGIFWLERGASCSQTRRDTNFAIPGYSISVIIPRWGRKSKIFLSVVIHVVKAAFVLLSAIGENPANAGVARLCGVSPCPVPDTATALPKQAFCRFRYTDAARAAPSPTDGEPTAIIPQKWSKTRSFFKGTDRRAESRRRTRRTDRHGTGADARCPM